MNQSTSPVAAMVEAVELEKFGRFNAAQALYRQILESSPSFDPAWHALGLLAYRTGQLGLAAEYVAKAINHNNSVALYHRNFGEMCRRLKQLDEAIAAGRRAVALAPTDAEAHYNLALALSDDDGWQEAATCYRNALELRPDYGLAWNNLGAALEQLADLAGAEEAYARAVALSPRHAEAQNNLGAIYAKQGKLGAAVDGFNAAIQSRPSFVEAHCNLSNLKRYCEGDAHVLVLEALGETMQNAPANDRIHLLFALGKARDDLRRYPEAFAAYALGNTLKYEQRSYDENAANATLSAFIHHFDQHHFQSRPLSIGGEPNRIPIFIVGMPRSGTSLLEQILASHPEVFGAGELSVFDDLMSEAGGTRQGAQLPGRLLSLSDEDLQRLGKAYLERVWPLAPHQRYIVDKMPANYFWVGLIRRLLPQAKIIHALRDPMDIGLSCFTRLFDDPQMSFTYDQSVLGRYYRRYATLMQHWGSVLPQDAIHSVRYEEVIAQPEIQIRRLLDFIGLPWDAAVMNFHKNQRPVKTASLAQVRKPLYADSVGRWRRFSTELAPLLAHVEDLRTTYQ